MYVTVPSHLCRVPMQNVAALLRPPSSDGLELIAGSKTNAMSLGMIICLVSILFVRSEARSYLLLNIGCHIDLHVAAKSSFMSSVFYYYFSLPLWSPFPNNVLFSVSFSWSLA